MRRAMYKMEQDGPSSHHYEEIKGVPPSLLQILYPLLTNLPEGAVLDYAGGTGVLAKILRSWLPGHLVLTSDIHSTPIPKGEGLVCKDSLPFAANGLAAVVMKDALVHVSPEERAVLFAEIARALKPGGRFILVTYLGSGDWYADTTIYNVDPSSQKFLVLADDLLGLRGEDPLAQCTLITPSNPKMLSRLEIFFDTQAQFAEFHKRLIQVDIDLDLSPPYFPARLEDINNIAKNAGLMKITSILWKPSRHEAKGDWYHAQGPTPREVMVFRKN